MGWLGQTGVAGRQVREWVRGGKQRRLQMGRSWFGKAQDLGHQRCCSSLPHFYFLGTGAIVSSLRGM
jgi:hypothetical protein